MTSIFHPNITIAEIKTAFGITSPDQEVGVWLNRMANLLVNFGISPDFKPTEITEELLFDEGFSTNYSIIEILETNLKQNNTITSIDKNQFSFSKYDFFARADNCFFGQNQCYQNFSNNSDEIFNDAIGVDLYTSQLKYQPNQYIQVKYRSGIDLTNSLIKADFMNILSILYSELGLNFAPSFFGQKGAGNLKKWQVDSSSNEFADISQSKFDKTFFLSRFPILARILTKYIGSHKLIF
jgi:hypothetical protein